MPSAQAGLPAFSRDFAQGRNGSPYFDVGTSATPQNAGHLPVSASTSHNGHRNHAQSAGFANHVRPDFIQGAAVDHYQSDISFGQSGNASAPPQWPSGPEWNTQPFRGSDGSISQGSAPGPVANGRAYPDGFAYLYGEPSDTLSSVPIYPGVYYCKDKSNEALAPNQWIISHTGTLRSSAFVRLPGTSDGAISYASQVPTPSGDFPCIAVALDRTTDSSGLPVISAIPIVPSLGGVSGSEIAKAVGTWFESKESGLAMAIESAEEFAKSDQSADPLDKTVQYFNFLTGPNDIRPLKVSWYDIATNHPKEVSRPIKFCAAQPGKLESMVGETIDLNDERWLQPTQDPGISTQTELGLASELSLSSARPTSSQGTGQPFAQFNQVSLVL